MANLAYRLAHRTPFFYGWVVLISAGSSQVVRNAAASLTLAVFMFPLSDELGWSRTLISGAATLGGLAASFASPVVGWLVDRYGARLVLAVSILVLGLSTISLAWATAPLAFYLAYGLGRVIFSSPVQIGASVVVSRWFIRMRGTASGILTASHSVGMVLFPLIAGLVIANGNWRDAWIVLGGLVWVIALIPVSLLIIQRPEDVGLRPDGDDEPVTDGEAGPAATAEPEWTLRQAMRTPALWILAIATGSLFLMQAGTNIHIGAYFRDQDLSQTIATIGIALNAAFLGVGSIVWGWIVDRVAVRYVMAGVAITMTVASGLFITVDSTVEALAYSALFGFGLGGMLAVPPVAYANYYGRRSLGAIRGVTEPFTSLGQAIGALIPGAIFDLSGSYLIAFITFTAFGGATALITLAAKSPGHAPAEISASADSA